MESGNSQSVTVTSAGSHVAAVTAWVSTSFSFLFFFNDTATTEIYTLSLHDALPILDCESAAVPGGGYRIADQRRRDSNLRSEEHTSELQSQSNLVCRLLLEKKKTTLKTQRTAEQQNPAYPPARVTHVPAPRSTVSRI